MPILGTFLQATGQEAVVFDGIPVGMIGIGSGWALFGLLAFGIARVVVRGDWIPRATYDAHIALMQQRIDDETHDAQEWRTEGRIKDQQIAEKDTQIHLQSEGFRTVEAIMRAIQSISHANYSGGSREEGDT